MLDKLKEVVSIPSTPAMTKKFKYAYECYILPPTEYGKEALRIMNALGEEGWEVVSERIHYDPNIDYLQMLLDVFIKKEYYGED